MGSGVGVVVVVGLGDSSVGEGVVVDGAVDEGDGVTVGEGCPQPVSRATAAAAAAAPASIRETGVRVLLRFIMRHTVAGAAGDVCASTAWPPASPVELRSR